MQEPPDLISSARRIYDEGAAMQERLEWLTKREVLEDLRAFRDGERKSLSDAMVLRLADYAAWTGQLPENRMLRARAEELISDWNLENPYGVQFRLDPPPVATEVLVRGFLGSTGTKRGGKRRTRYKQLSTDALDSTALHLRSACPYPWYINGQDPDPSPAERWLLEQLLQIEPLVSASVVRAIIDRTTRR